MQRLLSSAALLAALVISGCGKANSPPPGPAPAYQPSATTQAAPLGQTPQANGGQPTANQPPADQATEGQPGEESSLTSRKEPPADENNEKEMPDEANAAPPAKAADETPQTADAAPGDDDRGATRRSNRPGRKLLRGLTSSLGRALSKAASNANSSDSGQAEKPDAAPKLEDDPFPKGEPGDSKPDDDKPNE